MSTTTIKTNIIYALKEGGSVADATMLAYALRWANDGYRDMINRPWFDLTLLTKANFTMTDGQQSYQAPSDFAGLCTMLNVSRNEELVMVTPQDLQRDLSTDQITDETFTSSLDTAVSLDNKAIVQYSEVVADDTDHTNVYTRDSDYTMDYTSGTITVDSTGTMSDATTYYIDYLYMEKGAPEKFCVEYDSTNARFVLRMSPVPDSAYIGTLVYPDFPSDLSASVDAIWSRLEFAIEKRGIYYGSLELFEPSDPLIARFDMDSEKAMEYLRQRLAHIVPKHDRIEVCMRKSDY